MIFRDWRNTEFSQTRFSLLFLFLALQVDSAVIMWRLSRLPRKCREIKQLHTLKTMIQSWGELRQEIPLSGHKCWRKLCNIESSGHLCSALWLDYHRVIQHHFIYICKWICMYIFIWDFKQNKQKTYKTSKLNSANSC